MSGKSGSVESDKCGSQSGECGNMEVWRVWSMTSVDACLTNVEACLESVEAYVCKMREPA